MSQAAARVLELLPQDFIPESELVASDGVPVETSRQRKQINLSIDVIEHALAELGEDDFHVGGNQFVYYSTEQARAILREVAVEQLSLFTVPDEETAAPGKKQYRGPDVFVVKGVERRERELWASWLEGGRLPDFIFEFQSPSTADVDAGEKRELYAEVFKTREYFYYGPDDPELGRYRDVLVGLRLDPSGAYEPIQPDERGWIRSEVLGFYVGRWDGVYDSRKDRWIRLYDPHGQLVLTGQENALRLKEEERRLRNAAEERAEKERQRAEAAEAEIARLKRLLGSGGT